MSDASRLIAEQLRSSYTVMAGRGTALLGTEETTENIAAIIRAYGAQCAREAREEDAAYLEARAAEIEDSASYATQWMARIFRDEATAIRALS